MISVGDKIQVKISAKEVCEEFKGMSGVVTKGFEVDHSYVVKLHNGDEVLLFENEIWKVG